ncbi:Sec20-domain-containing protein [Apodospora peruviana]|uniref:Sec20-domain-containing protein n=1 Tax=Apodospora peruviana TaxID=516989 RepID=A0AAE0IPK8_9PEZI|nr:Sec20-domain-containing protein [Apodospora peruviana]
MSSSFEALQDRLTALQETTGQLKELIDRLATIKFQPGSLPLPKTSYNSTDDQEYASYPVETNVATELSAEINQILREEEEELELLGEEILDISSSNDTDNRRRLKEGVQRLDSDLKGCRSSFRKAQLQARNSLLAAQKLERQLLLGSFTPSVPASPVVSAVDIQQPEKQNHQNGNITETPVFSRPRRNHHKRNKDRDVVSASSDVTEALRRTHSMITDEVSKSAFARQTLAESTEALKQLQQNYEGIDGLLTRSRALVGTLLKSQKSDTWYLRTAFYICLATLAWLVFRRFMYGPLWWLVWFPMRTFFRTASRAGSAISSSGGKSSGARMEIVGGEEEGYRVIRGVGEEGAVPTVKVGVAPERVVRVVKKGEEEESYVEKVGRIIEDTLGGDKENETEADELDGPPQGGEEEIQKNPKKRMWEEPPVPVQQEIPVRDEL